MILDKIQIWRDIFVIPATSFWFGFPLALSRAEEDEEEGRKYNTFLSI